MKQNEMGHFQEVTSYSEKRYFVAIFDYTDKALKCLWNLQDIFFVLVASVTRNILTLTLLLLNCGHYFYLNQLFQKHFFFLYGAFQHGELSGKGSKKVTRTKVWFRPMNQVLKLCPLKEQGIL